MGAEALIALAAATFTGALVQAATGFGFAILAAPVFLAVLNSKSAIPLLIALHVVQSLMLAPAVLGTASRWHLNRLIAGAVPGTLAGIAIFHAVSVGSLKLMAGVVILAMLGLVLIGERRAALGGRAAAGVRHGSVRTAITGAIAAAMTVLLVMPGPPLMLHFMTERQPARFMRALSLTFFGLCYVALAIYHAAAGSYSGDDLGALVRLAPAVIVGTIAGRLLLPYLPERMVRVTVLALLGLAGAGAIRAGLKT